LAGQAVPTAVLPAPIMPTITTVLLQPHHPFTPVQRARHRPAEAVSFFPLNGVNFAGNAIYIRQHAEALRTRPGVGKETRRARQKTARKAGRMGRIIKAVVVLAVLAFVG
jgi:hypothetical protein